MQLYDVRAADVVSGSQIAVLVLAPDDYSEIEVVPLRPWAADESVWADLRARWPGRGLQARGVIGLSGSKIGSAFKEPPPEPIIAKLGLSFAVYVRSLLGIRSDFVDQWIARAVIADAEQMEIAELERIYNYADPSAPIQ